MKKKIILKNLDQVLTALDDIEQFPFTLSGQWDGYQHLYHCAQALYYNRVGYDVNKPYLFRETVGKLIFHIFKLRGHMSHNINEFTPGTTPIGKNGLQSGIAYYRREITALLDYSGPFKPHAFFGKLTKDNVITYHTMHFANHYETFDFDTKNIENN